MNVWLDVGNIKVPAFDLRDGLRDVNDKIKSNQLTK